MKDISIPAFDLVIILAYLLIIIIIGILSAQRKRISSEGFFLAGRSLNWAMIGAALFAANISTIHMVGLAANGFKDGIVWGNFEWMATFLLIILALFFAPFYFKNKVSTLPQFLEKRYGPNARSFFAFIVIITALFSHIGVSLYAGAVVLKTFFGIDIMVSILVISFITTLYSILGGLRAIVVIESFQSLILIGGAALLTILSFSLLPDKGIHSMAELRAVLRPNQLDILQTGNTSILPWYAILLGYPVLGIYYWCADQTIVQKVLGAKTMADAQNGPLFAGFLKILPVFIMVFPGILAYALFSDKIADPNDTLMVLISNVLPSGLMGLMTAALLAALMSTISAALNSVGTLVSLDIVKRIRPSTPDKIVLRAGRITSLVVIILAISWSPWIGRFESIFDAVSIVLSMLSPPVASVFVMGILSRRGNDRVALSTMIFGLAAGAMVFCLDFDPISGSKLITDGLGIPFLMQAWWLFVFCIAFYLISSFYSKPRPLEEIQNLIFTKEHFQGFRSRINSIKDPRIWTGILLIIMILLYVYFG
ncbi:MAG: sodium:glucose symporter [Bacteroides sp. SM1_62]|nr:MAG: sodium:glucose symporter [Bacteroides sp. SM1_62]